MGRAEWVVFFTAYGVQVGRPCGPGASHVSATDSNGAWRRWGQSGSLSEQEPAKKEGRRLVPRVWGRCTEEDPTKPTDGRENRSTRCVDRDVLASVTKNRGGSCHEARRSGVNRPQPSRRKRSQHPEPRSGCSDAAVEQWLGQCPVLVSGTRYNGMGSGGKACNWRGYSCSAPGVVAASWSKSDLPRHARDPKVGKPSASVEGVKTPETFMRLLKEKRQRRSEMTTARCRAVF